MICWITSLCHERTFIIYFLRFILFTLKAAWQRHIRNPIQRWLRLGQVQTRNQEQQLFLLLLSHMHQHGTGPEQSSWGSNCCSGMGCRCRHCWLYLLCHTLADKIFLTQISCEIDNTDMCLLHHACHVQVVQVRVLSYRL